MSTASRNFYAFSATNVEYGFNLLQNMEPMSSALLEDGFQIACDIAVVKAITVERPSELHWHLGDLLQNPVGSDLTFEVGAELVAAHSCVFAVRSTVFMAELFGPGKENAVTRVRIDGMDPKVFRALLHFIYTDSLPDQVNNGDDKIMVVQGLLAAADRYNMERLKLICGDVLCNCIDASTAVATLQLAHKHGCRELNQACIRFLKHLLHSFNLEKTN